AGRQDRRCAERPGYQGRRVPKAKEQSMSYVPPPSGLIRDPILQWDPGPTITTIDRKRNEPLINVRAPAWKCCFDPLPLQPDWKEFFPIDPLGIGGRVVDVASRLWPFR